VTTPKCSECGGGNLTFDWTTGVTSVGVVDGRITHVTQGGVTGAYPDMMLCHDCGHETYFEFAAATPVPSNAEGVMALVDALPARVQDILANGQTYEV
jgi:uncharacterized NAD-dependent epimerase/dehydratase family protein